MVKPEKATNDKAFKPLVFVFIFLVVLLVIILITDNQNIEDPSLKERLVDNTTNTTVEEITVDDTGNIQISKNNEQVLDASKDESLEVYFFNVGQADSILINQGIHSMVIDGGNTSDGKLLKDYITENLGIEHLDLAIASHVHEDHIGGLDDIIKAVDVDRFIIPKTDDSFQNKSYLGLINAVNKKGLQVENPKIGDTYKLGDANIEVLYVDNSWPENLNNSSIVLELTYKDKVFWFMGDSCTEVEDYLRLKDIDVLKVAHHGSKTSSSEELISNIKPEISIITSGTQDFFNLPSKKIVERLERNGSKVYRTDLDGIIHVVTDGQIITVDTIKDVDLDGDTYDT